MARRLLKSMATVSGLTFLSRILGFVRQMLLAGIVGASGNPVADAFNTAFRLPNMFRRLLAEGAFHAAFIPLFQKEHVAGDLDRAKIFAEQILAWLIVILTGLSALIMIFTPAMVSILASGFRADPERFELTVIYSRIMFPYLFCMSMVGLLGGMLNALGRFAAAAAAPLLLNICLIGALLLFARADTNVTGYAAAWAVMVGGVLQLLALLFAAARSKLLLRLQLPRFSGAAQRMLVLGMPGFIGASALQVNGVVGTNIASRGEQGAVSWLAFADQLYQLPLAMIGIALGVVLMPTLGRAIKSGAEAEATATLNRGIEIAFFLVLPAAVALFLLGDFLCAALFQSLAGAVTAAIGAGSSAFNDNDVNGTGLALTIYSIGLPAFVLQKILAAAFFARENTKTPMTFALVAIAVNATLSISLFPVLGYLSVPVGTIIASWVEVIGLGALLIRQKHLRPDSRLGSRILRTLVAASVLGGILWLAEGHMPKLTALTFGQDWIALFLIVGVGMVLYGAISLVIGAVRTSDLKRS